MRRRVRPGALFPVAAWPPFVDALTLVLAAFVLLMVGAFVVQRTVLARTVSRDEVTRLEQEKARLREEKARIERRLQAMAPRGVIEVEDGRVILQGEVLFASGSAALTTRGHELMTGLGQSLATLLAAERDQMLLVGGHTDDKALRQGGRFASNWELSTARALAVSRVLIAGGVPPAKIVASGFGEYHPRAANDSDNGRRRNRRIEVLVVPMTAVSQR